MTGYGIYRTAVVLADHGLTWDTATTADLYAAADHAAADRPDTTEERLLVRETLGTIAPQAPTN